MFVSVLTVASEDFSAIADGGVALMHDFSIHRTEFCRDSGPVKDGDLVSFKTGWETPDLFVYFDDEARVLEVRGGKEGRVTIPVPGQRLDELYPRSLSDYLRSALQEVLCKGDVRNVDYNLRIGGEERFFESRFLPMNNHQVLMIVRDVTEKMRLESIAEALVTMNQIGCIFSGIRHEIGNPLNSIKMTLSVLKKNLDSFDRMMVDSYIQRSLDELAKIEFLLKSLKNFTIYDRVELETVKVDTFFIKFAALIRDECEGRAIRLVYSNLNSAEGFIIDSRALQQVMLNIFANAFHALNGVAHPQLSIVITAQGDDVRVMIGDNGSGMDDDQLNNLFRPFYTNKSGGSGLGLVIAKKMIVQMNGSIWITSSKGVGTQVIILVPKSRQRNE